MAPEAGTAAAAGTSYYGLKKADDVLQYIYSETATQQMALQRVLDSLSANPRPPGYKPVEGVGPGLTRYEVDSTNPTVVLIYRIDDEARCVDVVAIMPMRFQG